MPRKLLHTFLFISFLLGLGMVNAQILPVDSLRGVLRNPAEADTNRIKAAIRIATFFYTNNPDSMLPYLDEGEVLSEQQSNPQWMFKIIFLHGIYHFVRGEYDLSYEMVDSAVLRFPEGSENPDIARAYNLQGAILSSKGHYETALEKNFLSLEIKEKLGNPNETANTLNNIGLIYMFQKDYENAIDYLGQADEISDGDVYPLLKAQIQGNLGSIYSEIEDWENALEHSHRSLKLKKSIGANQGVASSSATLGNVYTQLGDYESAHEYLNTAEKIGRELNVQNVLGSALNFKGNLLSKEGKYAAADRAYSEAKEILEGMGNREMLSDVYLAWSASQEERGNPGKALDLYRSSIELQDSLFSEKSKQRIEELRFKYQDEQSRMEYDLLREQSRADQAQIERSNLLFLAIGLGLALALAVIVFLLLSIFRNQKARAELESRQRRLEELNSEKDSLLGIVAHDLKSPLDKVKGLAHLVSLQGELNEEQQEVMEMIAKVSDNGTNLIRDLLDITMAEKVGYEMDLRPIPLNEFAGKHLQSYSSKAAEKSIELNFAQNGEETQVLADEEYLSRIVENIVSNALKFSPAGKKVWVRTYREKGMGVFSVRDEGPGISKDDQRRMFRKFQKLTARPTAGESSTGLGLSIIKTLSEKMNAEVEVISEPGKGANFLIRIPLVNEPQS